jgi:hypothetical protein
LSRYVMEWFPADLGSIFGWLLLGSWCWASSRPSSSRGAACAPPTR